jgi:hypothetical protein
VALYTQGRFVNIKSLIVQAEPKLAERVRDINGLLGTLDAISTCFSDYSITLSCISLLNPDITIEDGFPIASFPGSIKSLPIDCFHVDNLHHSSADGQEPEVFKAIGVALAESWNRILKESNISGKFIYNENNGYDIEYRI